MHKKEPNENNRLSFRTILFRGILRVIIIPTCVMLLLIGTLIGIFHIKYLIEAHQAQTNERPGRLEKKAKRQETTAHRHGGAIRNGPRQFVPDAHGGGSSYPFRV